MLLQNKTVIVCKHIALHKAPDMRAVLDSPISDEDSGWQFLCGNPVEHAEQNSAVWTLSEVMQYEPSLRPWIEFNKDNRETIVLERSIADQWEIKEM